MKSVIKYKFNIKNVEFLNIINELTKKQNQRNNSISRSIKNRETGEKQVNKRDKTFAY